MTKTKLFLILFLAIFIYEGASAGDAKLTFEPIVGMETTLVRYPEPARYVTRGTYGARVLYGVNFLSAEAEYTTAKSRKDYPSTDTKVEDTAERLALGLRSTIPLGKFIGFYLRAGGRASRGESIITTAGVSETKENPQRVDPYAGAGFQIAFHSMFALNAGATMIKNAEGKYDSQYTLGLSARFGKL